MRMRRLTQVAVVGVLACLASGGCSWREVTLTGPPGVVRESVPGLVREFEAFGRLIEAEQDAGRDTPINLARQKKFGFLVDVCGLYEVSSEERSNTQAHLYTGRCLEGYDAFREWWKGYDKPVSVRFGKYEITPDDYENLRYYETELSYEATFGHPLHEEMVRPEEILVLVRDKLELIALRGVILDVRKEHWVMRRPEVKDENFGGRIGRYFISIINAVLGNGPANMAPTPKVQ